MDAYRRRRSNGARRWVKEGRRKGWREREMDKLKTRDFGKRFEWIGEYDEPPAPPPPRRRRTVEDCIRETEEQRRAGVVVICRPTIEGIARARGKRRIRDADVS